MQKTCKHDPRMNLNGHDDDDGGDDDGDDDGDGDGDDGGVVD